MIKIKSNQTQKKIQNYLPIHKIRELWQLMPIFFNRRLFAVDCLLCGEQLYLYDLSLNLHTSQTKRQPFTVVIVEKKSDRTAYMRRILSVHKVRVAAVSQVVTLAAEWLRAEAVAGTLTMGYWLVAEVGADMVGPESRPCFFNTLKKWGGNHQRKICALTKAFPRSNCCARFGFVENCILLSHEQNKIKNRNWEWIVIISRMHEAGMRRRDHPIRKIWNFQF